MVRYGVTGVCRPGGAGHNNRTETVVANKDEKFPCAWLMRSGIAEDLNSYLDAMQNGEPRLVQDDERLTSEICVRYADTYGDLNLDEDSGRDDLDELKFDTLTIDLGYDLSEESEQD